MVGVVGGVLVVVLERDRVLRFGASGPDRDLKGELPQGGHHLGVELGHRLGFQCHRPLPTVAGADEQSVGAKSNSMA